jgi:hypothetical protein
VEQLGQETIIGGTSLEVRGVVQTPLEPRADHAVCTKM